MATVEWRVRGREFVNCNCAYGCPCQFNALPTYGDCRGMGAFEIDEGHFADTRLDGLRAVVFISWPGPIHEGGGSFQAVIDARADGPQRAALSKILHGEDTEPGATVWQVFSATTTTVHAPLYRPIELRIDVEARQAQVAIVDLLEASGTPILNPVTGEAHRARIELPNGFEYSLAEMGSGSTRASGAIRLDLDDSYGQFAHIHLSQSGVVR